MSKKPLLIGGLLAGAGVLLVACLLGTLVFWMMLGSPWPIDLSAFAE